MVGGGMGVLAFVNVMPRGGVSPTRAGLPAR